MISPAAGAPGAFGPAPAWTPVELFTGEQRLSCQVLLRGRLRERLLDTESAITVHGVTTVEARKTIPRLNGVGEGMVRREHIVAFWTPAGDPVDPDAPAVVSRPVLIEGPTWIAAGVARIPAGVEREQHLAFVHKNSFCQLFAVQLTADWDGTPSTWTVPEAYVNLQLAIGVYLG